MVIYLYIIFCKLYNLITFLFDYFFQPSVWFFHNYPKFYFCKMLLFGRYLVHLQVKFMVYLPYLYFFASIHIFIQCYKSFTPTVYQTHLIRLQFVSRKFAALKPWRAVVTVWDFLVRSHLSTSKWRWTYILPTLLHYILTPNPK